MLTSQLTSQICHNCELSKPFDEFYVILNGQYHSLKHSACKSCEYTINYNEYLVKNKDNAANKLKNIICGNIRSQLKKELFYINNPFDLLPYSPSDLKFHLENQFSSWMNWNNWGKYVCSTWNDNNFATWKWQIDHIVPKSKFIINSRNDISLQQCWALDNLRPLSAKQNLLDGVTKARHENYKTI